MTDSVFIDSNIWVYAFSREDENKYKISHKFIFECKNNILLVTSHQVINEVSNILLKKKFSEKQIRNVIEYFQAMCFIQENNKEIALLASDIREKYSVSFWDSQIIASAITAGCNRLASEDMQDGQIINGTRIYNIYK